jgi:hypothetical protein
MMSEWWVYLHIILLSAVKFVSGPVLGPVEGLNLIETVAVTVIGTMISVVSVSYLGKYLRIRLVNYNKGRKNYRVFTKRKRQIVKIWQKTGLKGVAFLTPILLTPIGGTLIAISFGVAPKKIVPYMFVSSVVWGFIISLFFFYLVDHVKMWLSL